MAITNETKRTRFYKELPEVLQKQYLGLTREKFLPNIDNLYYSIFLEGDKSDFDHPNGLTELLDDLEAKKNEANQTFNPVDFGYGLSTIDKMAEIGSDDENEIAVSKKKYTMYGYCLTEPDLYDIFICKAIPNENTPRIIIQLRAHGLWTRKADEIVKDAYNRVEKILHQYCGNTFGIIKCRENRVDYCYHTNAISNVGSLIKKCPRTEMVKNMHTNLKEYREHGHAKNKAEGVVLKTDYICFGQVSSNNVRARVYDKVKEVIEQGYKEFFFKIWHENGLISYYDKWCMEYAFPYKNMDYLYKASLAFYVEHFCHFNTNYEYKTGPEPEYYDLCTAALTNEKTTLADFKTLAKKHMPKVTSILNIEYETKRKFYYYMDAQIQTFSTLERDIPKSLERIYRILDNRRIFLEYLTRVTLSFYNGTDKDGEPNYLPWWKRLRNTKLDGIKTDEKMLREYSFNMDKRCVEQRATNAIASAAVYEDNVSTGFVEDLSDFMANLTDNQARKLGHRFIMFDTENGVELKNETLPYHFMEKYMLTKAKKERVLKNRKKRREEKHG